MQVIGSDDGRASYNAGPEAGKEGIPTALYAELYGRFGGYLARRPDFMRSICTS